MCATNTAKKWARNMEALRDKARGAGMDYHLLVTDRPLDDSFGNTSRFAREELSGPLRSWFLAASRR